ncbi:MAG TPA: response regulator [Candidatus Aquilonibacter sp.]|jgi:CheY-like chemotaxis protein|nr:response regulator [Candidatus Aquilonibacter sp.]
MIKVLMAEDSAVNRELLRELLESQGCEVDEAWDGEQALERLAQKRPDIVLLDIGMPKLDGFGVIQRVRQDPQLADLPVLAVTAYAMRGDREKGLDAGFDGYLSKPVDGRLLFAEMDRLLSLRRGCGESSLQTVSHSRRQKK